MKKNSKVLVLQIMVILIALIGTTYAVIYRFSINFSVKTASLAVDYTGSTTLPTGKLVPIKDSTVSASNVNVLKVNFTVKGASTNPTDKTIIYDIMLKDLVVPCDLKNTYTKWRLIKNGTTLEEGSFSPTFDTMASNQMFLTTTQQDLPANSATADSYQLFIWVSEACTASNITSCTASQDQRSITGQTISGTVQVVVYTDSKKTRTRTTGSAVTCETIYDNSGANAPVLNNTYLNLIPVTYDSSNNLIKANSSNPRGSWYNYDLKRWANAVLVTAATRDTYKSAAAGTAVAEADVLAHFVWIPRFKYKVWNINKVIGTDSYNAQTTGIDIVFEGTKTSTGSIKCTYTYPAATATTLNETCTGANGQYYTHPAFTHSSALAGFWVGKFELSSETPSATNGGGESITLTPRVKPNVVSWRGNTVSNFYKVIYDMQATNNIYGLGTSKNYANSHMMKNTEWGAVVYLTNSKYGRCDGTTCTEVTKNANTSWKTGNGAYKTSTNQSTTGNIYGVYDMNGGGWEYMSANISGSETAWSYNAGSAGTNLTYSATYVNPYGYGTTNSDQTAMNRSRLGDAMGEVVSSASSTGAWYGDSAVFAKSEYPWIIRGSKQNNTGTGPGIFAFHQENGGVYNYDTARVVLAYLK